MPPDAKPNYMKLSCYAKSTAGYYTCSILDLAHRRDAAATAVQIESMMEMAMLQQLRSRPLPSVEAIPPANQAFLLAGSGQRY